MEKMWHFAVPEPVVFLSIASCIPSCVLIRRWPLPCKVVSAIDRRSLEAELVARQIFGQIHVGSATTFCPKEPAYLIPHVDATDALIVNPV